MPRRAVARDLRVRHSGCAGARHSLHVNDLDADADGLGSGCNRGSRERGQRRDGGAHIIGDSRAKPRAAARVHAAGAPWAGAQHCSWSSRELYHSISQLHGARAGQRRGRVSDDASRGGSLRPPGTTRARKIVLTGHSRSRRSSGRRGRCGRSRSPRGRPAGNETRGGAHGVAERVGKPARRAWIGARVRIGAVSDRTGRGLPLGRTFVPPASEPYAEVTAWIVAPSATAARRPTRAAVERRMRANTWPRGARLPGCRGGGWFRAMTCVFDQKGGPGQSLSA